MTRPVHIIGVPWTSAVAAAASTWARLPFRIAGLGERLSALGFAVTDKGNIFVPVRETLVPRHDDRKYIDEIAQRLFRAVCRPRSPRSNQERCRSCLAAITAWSPASLRRRRPSRGTRSALPIGLLWVDAHGDMNTPATSPSGNVHGMPLAALLGPEPRELSDDRRLLPHRQP